MTNPPTHRRFLEVNEHEVVVRSTADQLVTVGDEPLRHRRRVLDHLHSNKCPCRPNVRGRGGRRNKNPTPTDKGKLTEGVEKLCQPLRRSPDTSISGKKNFGRKGGGGVLGTMTPRQRRTTNNKRNTGEKKRTVVRRRARKREGTCPRHHEMKKGSIPSRSSGVALTVWL